MINVKQEKDFFAESNRNIILGASAFLSPPAEIASGGVLSLKEILSRLNEIQIGNAVLPEVKTEFVIDMDTTSVIEAFGPPKHPPTMKSGRDFSTLLKELHDKLIAPLDAKKTPPAQEPQTFPRLPRELMERFNSNIGNEVHFSRKRLPPPSPACTPPAQRKMYKREGSSTPQLGRPFAKKSIAFGSPKSTDNNVLIDMFRKYLQFKSECEEAGEIKLTTFAEWKHSTGMECTDSADILTNGNDVSFDDDVKPLDAADAQNLEN